MVPWGRADLHMHTTASDGWPSPSQLVDHAARRAGLDVITTRSKVLFALPITQRNESGFT
jgi:hypothetical protein